METPKDPLHILRFAVAILLYVFRIAFTAPLFQSNPKKNHGKQNVKKKNFQNIFSKVHRTMPVGA